MVAILFSRPTFLTIVAVALGFLVPFGPPVPLCASEPAFPEVSADGFPPREYLTLGRWRSLDDQVPDFPNGREFFVAVTENRVLSGQVMQVDGSRLELLRYISSDFERMIQVEFRIPEANGSTFLSRDRREIDSVSVYEEIEDSTAIRLSRQVVGQHFPYAVHFSDYRRGVRVEEIAEALNSDLDPFQKQLSTGELTVIKSYVPGKRGGSGLSEIRLSQGPNDQLMATDRKRVRDSKFSRHADDRLQSVSHGCKFEPPLTHGISAWVAHHVIERRANKQAERRRFRVDVDRFIADAAAVNEAMDQILASIPNNQEILSNDPIAHIWHGGKPVRQIDLRAVQTARGLSVVQSVRQRLLWALAVAIGIAAPLIYFTMRSRR